VLSQVTSRFFKIPPGRLASGTRLCAPGAGPRLQSPAHRAETPNKTPASVLIARLKAEAEAERRRAALKGVA
jgi:hypothetical protein